MKRNIIPTYIDGPVEIIDVSQESKSISGKSSFVLVEGPEANSVYLFLPSRTTDDKPIVPGTMVTIVRKDGREGSVLVGFNSSVISGNDAPYGTSTLTDVSDSCTFMFVGRNINTNYDAWILVSSDLVFWSGGAVTKATTFSNSVALNGLTKIGNFRFSDANNSNNNPTIAFTAAGSGTAALNTDAHPNAAIITFSGVWANLDTAVITLPTGVTFEGAQRFILKNQPPSINGTFAVTSDTQITFTASGTCSGNLDYLVVVMGS